MSVAEAKPKSTKKSASVRTLLKKVRKHFTKCETCRNADNDLREDDIKEIRRNFTHACDKGKYLIKPLYERMLDLRTAPH